MADCYVQAIRKVQPNGPYRLLGWSFGGIVLQEMAAQLEAQGEPLDFGILLDSALSGDDFSDVEPHDEAYLLTEQAEALGIAVEGLSQDSLKDAILLAAKREGLMPPAAEISDVDLMMEVMRHAPTLIASWTGCPQLTAAITFIRSSDNDRSDLEDRLAALTSGPAQIFDVAATHNRMCDQTHSPVIALLVEDMLNWAQ
jgi:thioesterase domain-containing protein